MTEMPLVSVIIPTYNRVSTIEKSVRSVMNQTYQNLEIIVVDDGSTDGTDAVMNSLIKEDSRIRFIANDSGSHGPSQARNYGVKAAAGDLISFNDSDDEFRPDKTKAQVDAMINNQADFCFCTKKKGESLSPWKGFRQTDICTELILYKCYSGTQSIMVKAELMKQLLFDESMNCNEDWELLIRLTDGYKGAFVSDILVDVDDTPGSVGSSAERGTLMMKYTMSKHAALYAKYPASAQKMQAQIKYSEAVALDEQKHTIFTRIRRYLAMIKLM